MAIASAFLRQLAELSTIGVPKIGMAIANIARATGVNLTASARPNDDLMTDLLSPGVEIAR